MTLSSTSSLELNINGGVGFWPIPYSLLLGHYLFHPYSPLSLVFDLNNPSIPGSSNPLTRPSFKWPSSLYVLCLNSKISDCNYTLALLASLWLNPILLSAHYIYSGMWLKGNSQPSWWASFQTHDLNVVWQSYLSPVTLVISRKLFHTFFSLLKLLLLLAPSSCSLTVLLSPLQRTLKQSEENFTDLTVTYTHLLAYTPSHFAFLLVPKVNMACFYLKMTPPPPLRP